MYLKASIHLISLWNRLSNALYYSILPHNWGKRWAKCLTRQSAQLFSLPCGTCSTIIFPHSTDHIIDLWRCRSRFLNSLTPATERLSEKWIFNKANCAMIDVGKYNWLVQFTLFRCDWTQVWSWIATKLDKLYVIRNETPQRPFNRGIRPTQLEIIAWYLSCDLVPLDAKQTIKLLEN